MQSSNDKRFFSARERVLLENVNSSGIGTLAEKTLHKIIKFYIEPSEENHEVPFLGSVADIKNGDGIFEVQTASYERLLPKLEEFLAVSAVTVVVPLSETKHVRWIDPRSGEISEPRKSPKSEGIFDALHKLSRISRFICHKNFFARLIFLKTEEYRYLNGWDKKRKRGSTRCELIPLSITSEISISSPEDIIPYLPKSLADDFVASDFQKAIKRPSRFTYYVLRLLSELSIIERSGKRGRAFVYSKTELWKSSNVQP